VSEPRPPSAPAPGAPAAPPSPADAEARLRAAAERLLARAPDPAYLEAWTRSLQRALFDDRAKEERAAVVFRLGEDLYASTWDTFARCIGRAASTACRDAPTRSSAAW
jgi:acyl transferase domain-containing protein